VIDRGELAAWLRLIETPSLGRESARRLLAAFGSPEAVIAATSAARREVVGSKAASALDQEPQTLPALIESTWAWLCTDPTRHDVIPLGEPRYPAMLLEAPDPPLLLYVRGRAELLHADAIAIVGSRSPTAQGAENAQAFAQHLSAAGLTVVSGLALGVDAAAHTGALEGASSTIAVVGTGLDQIYPRRNRKLGERIAAEGLIVSEYPLGMPPLANNFPQRNRIIAGLARGTLVVEAALQSGSLITARLANEAGREVYAMPGSIHAPQSRGCHALIKQGAKLVETAQDILEELRLVPASSATAAIPCDSRSDVSDPLLAALGNDPATLDALSARTGLTAAALSVRLLDLELSGYVARLPGQLFQRLTRA
jgi:DNA processing protein